jgi:hypothetical protein
MPHCHGMPCGVGWSGRTLADTFRPFPLLRNLSEPTFIRLAGIYPPAASRLLRCWRILVPSARARVHAPLTLSAPTISAVVRHLPKSRTIEPRYRLSAYASQLLDGQEDYPLFHLAHLAKAKLPLRSASSVPRSADVRESWRNVCVAVIWNCR